MMGWTPHQQIQESFYHLEVPLPLAWRLQDGFPKVIGSGQNTSTWNDHWISSTPSASWPTSVNVVGSQPYPLLLLQAISWHPTCGSTAFQNVSSPMMPMWISRSEPLIPWRRSHRRVHTNFYIICGFHGFHRLTWVDDAVVLTYDSVS